MSKKTKRRNKRNIKTRKNKKGGMPGDYFKTMLRSAPNNEEYPGREGQYLYQILQQAKAQQAQPELPVFNNDQTLIAMQGYDGHIRRQRSVLPLPPVTPRQHTDEARHRSARQQRRARMERQHGKVIASGDLETVTKAIYDLEKQKLLKRLPEMMKKMNKKANEVAPTLVGTDWNGLLDEDFDDLDPAKHPLFYKDWRTKRDNIITWAERAMAKLGEHPSKEERNSELFKKWKKLGFELLDKLVLNEHAHIYWMNKFLQHHLTNSMEQILTPEMYMVSSSTGEKFNPIEVINVLIDTYNKIVDTDSETSHASFAGRGPVIFEHLMSGYKLDRNKKQKETRRK